MDPLIHLQPITYEAIIAILAALGILQVAVIAKLSRRADKYKADNKALASTGVKAIVALMAEVAKARVETIRAKREARAIEKLAMEMFADIDDANDNATAARPSFESIFGGPDLGTFARPGATPPFSIHDMLESLDAVKLGDFPSLGMHDPFGAITPTFRLKFPSIRDPREDNPQARIYAAGGDVLDDGLHDAAGMTEAERNEAMNEIQRESADDPYKTLADQCVATKCEAFAEPRPLSEVRAELPTEPGFGRAVNPDDDSQTTRRVPRFSDSELGAYGGSPRAG